MLASRRWLEAFLRQPIDSRDAADKLAMLGAPVDSITAIGAELAPFVVGLVTDVKQHPNADKLRIATVDDGGNAPLQIVCGAPNVTAGHRYPLARVGVTMPGPDGFKLKKSKLRGETSEGMLCSARELGLGTDHDGIYTLDTDAAPGTPLLDVLELGDDQLEVDVTPNRPDLFGHKGIARELAIAYRLPFRLPEIAELSNVDLPTPVRHGDEAVAGGIRVAIADRDCARFLGAVIRGVKVGPSPKWLVERLEAVGLRSINNVVDVTNYVMLELNQPMHAYDAATLAGPAVIVRAAHDGGETLTTLDGVERKVPAGTLLIADAEKAIGVAGVMGGANTEVTDNTTDLFLECAFFDASRVRAGKKAINLATDASQRFERGTDRWGAVDAFRRALRMLVTVAGGELDGQTIDCFPAPSHPPRIFLRPARVTQVLGVELEWKEIERCLVAIGSTVVSKPDDARIAVDVPGWRPDLISEIDLVEEVARVHGYDNIPTEVRPFRPGLLDDDPLWAGLDNIRREMSALGLSEVMSLSMRPGGGERATKIQNPLSADHGVLRDSLLPALVEQVESNWAVHTRDVRLYETGTVFESNGPKGRPTEHTSLAFVVTGGRHSEHWGGGKPSDWNDWDAKWLFEQAVAIANPDATVAPNEDGWQATSPNGDIVGRCAPSDADSPPWAGSLYGAELIVAIKPRVHRRYQALPTQPEVTRDLALLVGDGRSAGEIVEFLELRGRKLSLISVDVVDEYRGDKLPAGTRSIAVRLVFRASDRTLKDTEVDKSVGRLVSMLERELDVTLRSS